MNYENKNREELIRELHKLQKEISALRAKGKDEVSNLKSTKKQLSETQKRLENTLDSIADGFVSLDNNWIYTEVNQKAAEMFGRKAEELIGKHIWTEFPEGVNQPFYNNYYKAVRNQTEINFEDFYKPWNRWYENRVIPSPDGLVIFFQDITDRKKAEIAMKESHETFRTLFESSSHPILLIKDYLFVRCNQAALDALGISEMESFIGTSPAEVSPERQPDGRLSSEAERVYIEEAYEKGFCKFEWTHKNMLGGEILMEVTLVPIQLNGVTYLHVAWYDLTYQKEIERKLIENERRLSTLLGNMPGVAYICKNDHDWTMEYVSNGSIELVGYTPDELINNRVVSFNSLIKPEYRKTLFNKWQVALKNGDPLQVEYEIISRDGSVKWVWEQGAGIYSDNGEVIAIEGFITDITERKIASLETRRSETKFRSIFDSKLIGSFFWNLNGDITDANDLFLEMLGYTRKDLLNGDLNWEKLTPPEFNEIDSVNINQLAEKGYTSPFEKEYIHKDGHRIPIILGATTLPDDPDTGIAFVLNISRQKSVEKELQFEKERAEESDRLKTAFLANMSHEIRTPMNGILGFTSLLQEPKLTGEEQKSYIDIIEKSGARMLDIINNIIDISKLESGQVKISKSSININEEIDYIYNFFKPEAEKKGLEIFYSSQLPDEKSTIISDREKVNGILINLVKNAIKFTETGTVEIGCHQKNSSLEIFIKDTGIGILEEWKEKIFTRFVQVDMSDSRLFQGAGIGLAISKAYAEMLGGTIWVDSIKDKGSTFWFSIPYLQS
jgi:PAS domain S-box-containing protein